MRINFGTLPDGKKAYLYTLKNDNGLEIQVSNYGGIIVSLKVPDRQGKFSDVVLGYDKLADYVADAYYFGAAIGRCGNRIGNSKFTLNGIEYSLDANDCANHLHGGTVGFHKKLWEATPFKNTQGAGLALEYLSRNGEEGYPGNLNVKLSYLLTTDNALQCDYEATTDQPTICNLTHHSYFNLAGHDHGTILDHILMINADNITPVGEDLIPTGEFRPVEGTPFDLRKPALISAGIDLADQQMKYGQGYDHNWVLKRQTEGDLELAAALYEPETGRFMEVWTQEPGIQFYSGNFLDGKNNGKSGYSYGYRSGLCLETQHFPDSPNKPQFPTVILNPGEIYKTRTVYKFKTKD